MSLIDFILNLAGLLLWVSWRYVPFDPINKIRPATLTGTLRRAEPARLKAWHFLAALLGLLLVRAIFYWWIGGALSWTPGIKLGAIAISFRSDFFWRMVAYSAASFMHILMVYYLCLLLLSLLNPRGPDADSCQRFIRIQLGPIHGWPAAIKMLVPFFSIGLAWLAVGSLLAWWGIVPRTLSWLQRAEQAAVLGAGVYLIWRYVIGTVLALQLLNTYVYLGSHPLWNYVNATARRLLLPLERLPLRVGKVDFAPVLGIALVYAGAGFLENGLHSPIPGTGIKINIPGLVDIYGRISN